MNAVALERVIPTEGPQRPLPGWLVVRGAREHNLDDLTVALPHRSLVVFTGVSGSGKSTLAFDTIYAECQRRQVQSMPAFARQFLDEMDRPDADAMEGLCTAVALDQKTATRNPRSTVGTVTDVYDLLRLLYSRLGRPHCSMCDAPLTFDGGWICPSGDPELGPSMTMRGFSFNSPEYACVTCQGIGSELRVDPDLVVPDPQQSLAGGALAPWRAAPFDAELAAALAVATRLGVDVDAPWAALPQRARQTLLDGLGEPVAPEDVGTAGPATSRRRDRRALFTGLGPWLHRKYRDSTSDGARDRFAAYMRPVPCSECAGARLNPYQRAVRLGGHGIGELCSLPVDRALQFFRELPLQGARLQVAQEAVQEITTRLGHLLDVGLAHLTLHRPLPTLSGGEAARVRLVQQLGTNLFGLMYVLDEPTTGLHPADVDRLLGSLRTLRDAGNSVLIMEHDAQVVRAADWVVDLGPGAGADGGRLVHSGPVEELLGNPSSLTGGYLSGRLSAWGRTGRRAPDRVGRLVVRGAREHNLGDIDVAFPLGCLTAVTGVSGSGKSTLVDDVLYRGVARAIHDAPVVPGAHDHIDGMPLVDRVVLVDQSSIGRSPRSNAATYTGALDAIRALFANTDQARDLGFTASRFSFNTAGGRCECCGGDGVRRINMRFLPDVFVPCPDCGGTRYNSDTLRVRYAGCTIAEALDLPVRDALRLFEDAEAVIRPLLALAEVGLGYLRLGQPATTLSGGEAQRVKLATELCRRLPGHSLHILDEPTTGLHPEDVRRLLGVLHGLVDKGCTVVVVEHELSVVASADWVVELGPGGGREGGRLVLAGPPELVAASTVSPTGRYLRQAMEGRAP